MPRSWCEKKERGRANFERIKFGFLSFASKMSVVQNSCIKRIKLFLFLPNNKHLINRANWSVCMGESWGRVYRPHCVRSVLTTSVKILPYRPPAQLIRANYYMASSASGQDEPNHALWLATRAGQMEPSCPLGTTRCIPQETFHQKPPCVRLTNQDSAGGKKFTVVTSM